MVELTREEYNLIPERRGIKKSQNMSTKKLINTLNRCDSKRKVEKLSKIGLGKVATILNISENEVNQAEKLQIKSIDELKGIARLRRIKNRDKLTKEGLIISLLKSESSDAERNYMKHFNNNINDDTYDDKIRGKISDIRILSRLRNPVPNNDRKLEESFMKYEKRKTFQIRKKKRFMMILLN